MSKFCLVFFSYVLYTCCLVECGVVNTGTVLFSSRDVSRQCWHPEEIAVLTTRMILQDLLPDVNVLEITNDDYVEDIVEYFRLLFEVVQKSTQGRSRHITMLTMSDLIGGYLQHAVLPMARLAYYAGAINFPSVEKLIQLYEELKWFLRTNGQGWAQPLQPKTQHDIELIDLSKNTIESNKSCCRNLIYYQRQPVKRQADDNDNKPSKIYFPLPFFDSKVRPSAIAVPFRRYALRNIESKRAAYMVLKYYISVHNCLRDLRADKGTIESFQNNLFTWIEQNVMPKLKDNKFYSAFGGILRVEESLKSQGAKFTSNVGNTECLDIEGDQELGTVPGGEPASRSSVLLISMLVIIFIWFIIGTLFICYRIRANSKKGAQMNTSTAGSPSSSSYGSSSKLSSKRTLDTCKCYTTTEKSTDQYSSASSEVDKGDQKKGKRFTSKCLQKSLTFLDKCSKKDQAYGKPCTCGEPPTINHKHSMKVLPSIPEMSENSSKPDDKVKRTGKPKKISFSNLVGTSSKEDTADTRKNKQKMRLCVPKLTDVDVMVCPRYEDKGTSLSSVKSKSTDENGSATENLEPGVDDSGQKPEVPVITQNRVDTNENTTEDTSDNTGITANSPHIYACHSSLTGNYTTDQRFQTEKPFIFGYDFQTSSSSELSDDEESDARTSTTK